MGFEVKFHPGICREGYHGNMSPGIADVEEIHHVLNEGLHFLKVDIANAAR